MNPKPRTANYRRCYITDGQTADASGGQTLQQALVSASKSVQQPWLRRLGVGVEAYQLLTWLVSKNSCLCGELVFYEHNRKIPLVDFEKDGSTWQAAIYPKDATGRNRNFQEQSLVFAVRENHVAIIQSIGLQADELQEFFAWLIQSQAGLLKNSFISLQNLPAKSALDKLKDHKIRGIKIGEQLFTKVGEERPDDGKGAAPKRRRLIQRIEANPRIIEVLKALGIAQPIIEKLAQDPDPGSIQVDLDISYRSRTEKESRSLLNCLAATIGKQDGLGAEIRLDGKSVIKGDELSLRGQLSVQCEAGCMATDDAFSKLSAWLAEQIKEGKVT